jgi:hypothetical protein
MKCQAYLKFILERRILPDSLSVAMLLAHGLARVIV